MATMLTRCFFLLRQNQRRHNAKQNSEICSEHDVLIQYVGKKKLYKKKKNCSRETEKYEKNKGILQLWSKHESVAACLCLSCFGNCKYLASFLFAECSLSSCKVNILQRVLLLRRVRKSHLWFLIDRFCRWRIFFSSHLIYKRVCNQHHQFQRQVPITRAAIRRMCRAYPSGKALFGQISNQHCWHSTPMSSPNA